MFSSISLEIAVLALAVAGLAAVIAEIVLKDPRMLSEIVTDVAAMARPQRRGGAVSSASNSNFRKAA
ncbi:hypothetical protein IGS68_32345 (plasmid) [Skermanella sp. TT6]|uniref:Uncharacterized protein n=1 Tax=Skermanella cutis TaxID=2775420 RepID=A0ABX7BH35_9PROT|nr:hypothetical protein [Skermanella sp. TT6]QQP93705.1 hypothetical protein IGS68_32345 [Skermanella sp. TT6]